MVSMMLNPHELQHNLQFCYGMYYASAWCPLHVFYSKQPQSGSVNIEWSLVALETAKFAIPLYPVHVHLETNHVNILAMVIVPHIEEHIVLHATYVNVQLLEYTLIAWHRKCHNNWLNCVIDVPSTVLNTRNKY